MAFDLKSLKLPIIQAPMAGGPSTPALGAAVAAAGGMGFLAAGYKTADAVAQDIAELRGASAAPFGLNVFSPSREDAAAADDVAAYAGTLDSDARRHGIS